MGELEIALDTGLKERITSLTQLERLRVASVRPQLLKDIQSLVAILNFFV